MCRRTSAKESDGHARRDMLRGSQKLHLLCSVCARACVDVCVYAKCSISVRASKCVLLACPEYELSSFPQLLDLSYIYEVCELTC